MGDREEVLGAEQEHGAELWDTQPECCPGILASPATEREARERDQAPCGTSRLAAFQVLQIPYYKGALTFRGHPGGEVDSGRSPPRATALPA